MEHHARLTPDKGGHAPHEADDGASFVGPLLRPLILLLIGEEPVHGYGIVERLGKLGLRPKRATTLYRELRFLEEAKFIASSWDASQTRGPARRVYRLTARGRKELDSLMPAVASVNEALAEVLGRHRMLKAKADRVAVTKAKTARRR